MTIAVAETFYDVPEEMKAECRKRLPDDMLPFWKEAGNRRARSYSRSIPWWK